MKILNILIITVTFFLSTLQAMEMMDFIQRPNIKYQKSAIIENNNGALLLRSGSWTNGKNRGAGYDGNGVESVKRYNFIDSYVGIKFRVHAGGQYSAFSLHPKGFRGVMRYTTHNTWAGSKLIKEDIDLYQTLHVDKDGNWKMMLSKGGYDGIVLYSKRGKLSQKEIQDLQNTKLIFLFGDNRAGKNSWFSIEEIELLKNNTSLK